MSSHGGGNERWLVSYADFITLLFVLFLTLYSMGQVDLEKYKALAEGFRKAFAGGGPMRVVDPQIHTSGSLPEEAEAAPIVVEGLPMTNSTGTEVADELTDMLSEAGLGSQVSIQNNVEGVLISLSEKLVFIPGTAELHQEAYPVLDKIIEMIAPLENEIRVVGHTDNSPPVDPRYANNWELSLARGYAIVEYFSSKGISDKRLVASGRGDSQPIFPNDTPEHRTLNSRADIIIIYAMEIDVIKLDLTNPSDINGMELPDIEEGVEKGTTGHD